MSLPEPDPVRGAGESLHLPRPDFRLEKDGRTFSPCPVDLGPSKENIYGKCMENVWKIYGKSMEHVWTIYGNIWNVYGPHLENY
jgi:hypothetical protein